MKSAGFTKKEIAFINKIAGNAFNGNDRPIVLLGVCAAILENIVMQSQGKLTRNSIVGWLKKVYNTMKNDYEPRTRTQSRLRKNGRSVQS